MAVYSIIPNTNVSFNDIRDTLNANGGSVTNDFITAFQERANIKPWSKWKPVSSNFMFSSLEAVKAGNFGIEVISGNSPESVYSKTKANGNLGYIYHRPTGGERSPYRLGDFRNYNPRAYAPISATYDENEEVRAGGVTSSNHEAFKRYLQGLETTDDPTPDTATYLSKGDLYRYEDRITGNPVELKRGLLITDGDRTIWSTDYVPWAEYAWQNFKGKTVQTFEFLTNANNNPDYIYMPNMDDIFFALPDPMRNIRVTNSTLPGSLTVGVFPRAEFDRADSNQIKWRVYFSAIGDAYTGGTIRNVNIAISKDRYGTDPVSSMKIADSLSIPKGTKTKDYEGVAFSYHQGQQPNLYFLIYYNNKIQATTMVMSFGPIQPEI